MTVTVRDILIRKLKALGCDGLASEECGCGIDDLAPCNGDCLGCQPARSRVGPNGIGWYPVELVIRNLEPPPIAGAVRKRMERIPNRKPSKPRWDEHAADPLGLAALTKF